MLRQVMLDNLRSRGALVLQAMAVAWTIMALVFGLMAEAGLSSIIWAFFARVFLILAVGAGTVSLALVVWRSRSQVRGLGPMLRWLPAAGATLATTWWLSTPEALGLHGLLILGACMGITLGFNRWWPADAGSSSTQLGC